MSGIVFYNTGKFLSLRLPLKFIYRFAECLANLHYLSARNDKAHLKDNLKTIFPEKSSSEINIIIKKIFINFAKYLVDFFRFSLLNKNNIREFVEIKNLEYLDDALKFNKGVIALTAHIGNWELGGAALGILGYNFYALALPHKDEKVNEFFNYQRISKGVNVIPVGRIPTSIIKYLKENYIVAILADRDFTESGIEINFFNKRVSLPKGAAFFSIKSGAPLVLGVMLRMPDDKFQLIFEKPIIPDTNDASPENMSILMKKYSELITKYVRLYPEQWFMFRRFWERQNIL